MRKSLDGQVPAASCKGRDRIISPTFSELHLTVEQILAQTWGALAQLFDLTAD